jgi:hypothetical protein
LGFLAIGQALKRNSEGSVIEVGFEPVGNLKKVTLTYTYKYEK